MAVLSPTPAKTDGLDEATLRQLRSTFRGEALGPADPGYDSARKIWNAYFNGHPAVIARCTSTADVVEAVKFARSDNLFELSDQAIDAIVTHVARRTSPRSLVHMVRLGGQMNRADAGATAFGQRDASYAILWLANWEPDGRDREHIAWARGSSEVMRSFATGKVYVNFLEREDPNPIRAAHSPETYKKLVALKRKYDPENLFRLNQNIKPQAD